MKVEKNGKTRAIGYCRCSTDKQADKGLSLEVQQAKLAAYVELYDLEFIEIIIDAGESGKSLARPGLQKALAMLKSGKAEALVVVKLDRLTRSVPLLCRMVRVLKCLIISILCTKGCLVDRQIGRLMI